LLGTLKGFAAQAIRAVERHHEECQAILWIGGPSLAPPWKLPKSVLAAYADEEADAEEQPVPLADPDVGLAPVDLDELDRLHAAYAGVISYFDTQLGRVLDHLRKKKRIEEYVVCVTASSGLPLGEHSMTGMVRGWMHEETAHIPLIVRLPGAERPGERVSALTQPTDLMPTFQEILGVHVPATRGRSLAGLVRAEDGFIRPYAVSGLRVGASEEWLLRTPELALLLPISTLDGDPPRQPQLYAKPDDRWEVNDLAPRHEEYVQELGKTLRQCIAAMRAPGPLEYPPLPAEFPVANEEA
jgi:arylsulfatase A-like enzyme